MVCLVNMELNLEARTRKTHPPTGIADETPSKTAGAYPGLES